MISKLKQSTTLQFVLASLVVLNYQWLSGAITATLTEYSTATATILGIWVARETKEAYFNK